MTYFSVIVPVYNVENYLKECINSVLVQSFKDYELILVDDGSTDNSGIICDEYENKYENVYALHKNNGGASEARNYGIKKSNGTYLLFLDSDDYWDDYNALQKIYEVIHRTKENVDVVLFQAKLLYPNGKLLPDNGKFDNDFNKMNPQEELLYLSENGLLIGSACSKVVNRKFIIDNKLFFKVGIKHEDIEWLLRLANCLPKYVYSNQFFYIYRKGRIGSVTSNVNYEFLMQFANILEDFFDFTFCNEIVKTCMLGYVSYEYCILLAQSNFIQDSYEKRKINKKLKGMRDILKYDIHPNVKKINKVMKIIGFNMTKCLLGKYLKYRKR